MAVNWMRVYLASTSRYWCKACDARHSHTFRVFLWQTHPHVLLQLTEAAALKYTYITAHDNKSFRRCVGVHHVRYDFKLAWLGDRNKGKERLILFIRGFYAAKPFRRKCWNGVLSRQLTYMHIYREIHCSLLTTPTSWHAAIMDNKYLYNYRHRCDWLPHVATTSKFTNVSYEL